MPEEAVAAYEKQEPGWPTRNYEDWNGRMICGGIGVAHGEGMMVYYYIGSHESEQFTFVTSVERGFTEDGLYRVSLYTDLHLE